MAANVQVTVRVNTQKFDAAMDQYRRLTSKTVAEIVNTKAYYIALNALNSTQHANIADIRAELGQIVTVKYKDKKGKERKKKTFAAALSRKHGDQQVPLAEILVNAERKKQGQPLIFGKELTSEMRKLYARRIRSVNFVRAGWIPAIKGLTPLAKKDGSTQRDTSVKAAGEPKGGVIPGRQSDIWTSVCKIYNDVVGSDNKPSNYVNNIKNIGLQKAINKEAASMMAYVDKKLQEAADKTINRN